MNLQILIFTFFSFVGILLSILFALKKSNNKHANYLLATYTFLVSLHMVVKCMYWSGLLDGGIFVHINFIPYVLWMCYGPILYFYVRALLKGKKYVKEDLLFVIPPAIVYSLFAGFIHLSAADKIKAIQENTVGDYISFPSYGIWVMLGIMFFYGVLIYQKFKSHRKIGFKEGLWLKCLVASHMGFVFLFFLFVVLVKFEIMDPKYDYFIDAGISFFIGMLAYFGFVQPDVFEGKKPLSKLIPVYKKYSKSGLSDALSVELKNSLMRIMEEEKPYLKSDLRLNELSALLHVSRNHTSQIINMHFNLTFFDFINKYRVEEAKQLLNENHKNKLSVTAIAYQVGFNSRASFYKSFKKYTNQTPTTYVKHLKAI